MRHILNIWIPDMCIIQIPTVAVHTFSKQKIFSDLHLRVFTIAWRRTIPKTTWMTTSTQSANATHTSRKKRISTPPGVAISHPSKNWVSGSELDRCCVIGVKMSALRMVKLFNLNAVGQMLKTGDSSNNRKSPQCPDRKERAWLKVPSLCAPISWNSVWCRKFGD